jgi:hypothetical protein
MFMSYMKPDEISYCYLAIKSEPKFYLWNHVDQSGLPHVLILHRFVTQILVGTA